MRSEVKIRISKSPDMDGYTGIIFRDVGDPWHAPLREILSKSGKWREKTDASVIFDDEKIKVEVI